MAKIVYTSDLHGQLELYRAAGEAALDVEADALILGGDLCPGTPSARSLDLPTSQPEFLIRELAPLLDQWQKARPALKVLAIPGNDDCHTILEALRELEEQGLIENIHQTRSKLHGYNLVGLAFVPPTPFSIKDLERRDTASPAWRGPQLGRPVVSTAQGFKTLEDFEGYLKSHATIEQELATLRVEPPERTVSVIHCPPYETRCDVLYDGQHIGSLAVRRWIEGHQPLLTLHGHIHESPRMSGSFCDRIGRTWVVNPGCDHSRPHLVVIELEDVAAMTHSIHGRPRL